MRKRTMKEAFDSLHVAFVEVLGIATKTEYLTGSEAERCIEKMDAIEKQLADLRVYIHNRTVG